MTGEEIALICGISASAATLGWCAARLTLEKDAPASSAVKANAFSKEKVTANTKSGVSNGTTSPAGGDRSFAAVICFPSLALLRKATGDMATDHAISNFAQSIDGQFEDLRIQRIGKETIQCILTADTQDDAIAKMQAVVSVLGEDTYTNAKQGFEKPRAGLSEIEHFPAAQSAFDLALDSIEQDKDRLVNFAGGFGSSSGRKSSRELANDLREALKTDEVSLSYQPKLDVRNQTFRAAEALFRWDGGSARSHTIGDVILCAEKHGVIQDLTMWTLKRAVSDQLQLIDAGVELKTFVNLSGAVISDSEFTLKAVEIIKGASGRIGIEITETSVIEHASNALSNLELYEAAGAEVAIDDYGTGLSSLRYLKRIPAQELKIDREFIKDLTRSHRDPMIVRSTIDLAHALGLSVTAEGVDDPTKLALLKVMGCDQLQGFYIAKPMSLEALIAFLNDQNALISSLDSGPSLMLKRADVIGL